MAIKFTGQREVWITFLFVFIGFVFIYQFIFDAKIDLNGDNASYYILGKALHAGEGFVNANSIFKSPNNHFPPGYPALISLVMLLSSSFVTIKIANGLFLLGSIWLSYLLVRKFSGSNTVAWITLAFLLTNSHLLRYGTIMMSEMPFLFFALLSLALFIKTYDPGYESRYWIYVLAFLCMMIAFYIRTLGIALLASFLFIMLKEYKTKWKLIIAYAGGFSLLFLPWLLRGQRLGGSSYLKQLVMVNPYRPENGIAGFGDYFTRIFKNVERYLTREIPDVIFPFKKIVYMEAIETWEWIPGLILIFCIIIGIWKLPKFRWLAIIYFASTFLILLLWPDVWVGIRFILPLAPLLIMAMLVGVKWVLEQITILFKIRRSLPLWPVILVLYFNVSEISNLRGKARRGYEPKWENYFNLAKSFNKEGVRDLVVSCRKPSLFYLFSETFTTNYKYTPDHADLIEDLKTRKVNYVILDQLGYSSTYRYLYPAIQNNPNNFELIAKLENPDTYLLKFVPL